MDKIFLHEQLAGLFLLLHGRGGEKEGAPTTALQYLVQNKYTPGNIHSEYMGSAARRGNMSFVRTGRIGQWDDHKLGSGSYVRIG